MGTTDLEKQWLRQKLLEYKVKKGNLDELLIRMDMIPVSIALAQAAKESGWGTSRFALEGNAIFGQWTWDGQGIAPLKRDGDKNHKILKFPILRASVKAYQNNLNTHKSYSKFTEKRLSSASSFAYFKSAPKEYSTPSFFSAWSKILFARLKPCIRLDPSLVLINSIKANDFLTERARSSSLSIDRQASIISCLSSFSRKKTFIL